MTTLLHNVNEIADCVKNILKNFPENRLWLFYGEMGVGKTTLIKEFCKQLGVIDETSSPTFSIINEYHTENLKLVYHCDLYRLKNTNEIIDTGLPDLIRSNNHLFIEWPEKCEAILPNENVQIIITLEANGNRKISAK
jgi:tRNA threonylcarbamoyladenosine biosynthesis protein TsaE